MPVWRRRRRRFCHQHSPTAFRMLKRSQTAQRQRRGHLIQRHSEEGGASKGKQAWLRAGGGHAASVQLECAAPRDTPLRHAGACARSRTPGCSMTDPACAFDGAHPRVAPLLPLCERGVCVRACTARLRPKLSTRALRLQTSRCPAHASLAAWLPWPGAKKRLACAAAQLLGTRRRRRGRA